MLRISAAVSASFFMIHFLFPAEVSSGWFPGASAEQEALPGEASPNDASVSEMAKIRALTARETEVLQLLAGGHASQDIANELFISPTTVRTHIQNILRKLEVHSQLEAVAFAFKRGPI